MNEIQGYLTPTSDSDDNNNSAGKRNADKLELSDNERERGNNVSASSKPNVRTKQDEAVKINPPSGKTSVSRSQPSATPASTAKTAAILERYRFIPMRLTAHERMLLNVLNNALEVCEYTDVVDVTFSHTRKSKFSRILESLVDILSISAGLVVRF